MKHRLAGWVILLGLIAGSAGPLAAQTQLPPGFDPGRHLTVDQVRPGMTGYGLSVFQGTRPEPFTVEVVSVERGRTPGKAVVWIRCTDERMQKTGPVSGMSGSPIYLWSPGERSRTMDGRSGKMIGAFAYGFSLTKDAYAGVQPIEQMLDAGSRTPEKPADDDAALSQGSPGTPRSSQTLANLLRLAQQRKVRDEQTWRMRRIAELAGIKPAAAKAQPQQNIQSFNGQPAMPLALPMSVGSAKQAELLDAMLKPYRIQPVAASAPGLGSQLPPNWIDPGSGRLEPGGVLSVPLCLGDLDLTGVGTITEVLRDADGNITQVLGFGHAMFGEGRIHVPMATGYVHFVQPSITTSFKMGGTLKVVGSLLNDEQTAVVGRANVDPIWHEAIVQVDWPKQSKSRKFTYQLAHHEPLLPALAGVTINNSLTTDTEMPVESSVRMASTIRFEDGRSLDVTGVIPMASPYDITYSVVPPIAAMTENPYDSVTLESMETRVTVLPEVLMADISNIRLEREQVKPGEQIVVNVEMQPYRGEPFTKRLAIQVPEDAPDGRYPLVIGGAYAFQEVLYKTKPYLTQATDIDELWQAIEQTLAIKENALYGVLVLTRQQSLAIGRTPLPKLPSSRAALLGAPGSSRASAYTDSITVTLPMEQVIYGEAGLSVTVSRHGNGQE